MPRARRRIDGIDWSAAARCLIWWCGALRQENGQEIPREFEMLVTQVRPSPPAARAPVSPSAV